MSNAELIAEARQTGIRDRSDWEIIRDLADALEVAAVDLETKSVVHMCCAQVAEVRGVLADRERPSLAFARLHRILDEKKIGESL